MKLVEHLLNIFYANVLVMGCPLKCNVFDSTKINITPIQFGFVGQVIKIVVDAKSAGKGIFDVTIENGLTNVQYEFQNDELSFTSNVTGNYIV